MTIPWAYQIHFAAICVRNLLKDNISLVPILQRLYTSKNSKYTQIHHFDRPTDHSRNQPTVLTITIQTNYNLLYRPINFLYTLTQPTSLTSNVLLIRLFCFRPSSKTKEKRLRELRHKFAVSKTAQKINFLISFLKLCLRNIRSQIYCILLFNAKWFTNWTCN